MRKFARYKTHKAAFERFNLEGRFVFWINLKLPPVALFPWAQIINTRHLAVFGIAMLIEMLFVEGSLGINREVHFKTFERNEQTLTEALAKFFKELLISFELVTFFPVLNPGDVISPNLFDSLLLLLESR
jgi:hypothetical protein